MLTILALLAFASCAEPNTDKNAEGSAEQPYQVHYMGALKNIMHKGDLSAQASLSDFDTTLERNATLLVYAHVKDWEEVVIPQPAFEYETFEAFVAEQAAKRDLESPFPFLINGEAQSVYWHTINGMRAILSTHTRSTYAQDYTER